MVGTDKARASGVSATSFMDLKAELSKQEAEFSKNKAAGKTRIVGGVERPDKKPKKWALPNKGVAARAARDMEIDAVARPTLESARAALERKAKIYDKLRKGKSGGLNDAQYNALLVDFDDKPFEPDSEDENESLTVPRPPEDDDNDPVIEYEDEFGRIRTARRSEVPRELLPREQDTADDDEDLVIHNPVGHFPVYEPSAERIAAIEQEYSEANNPLSDHYDASNENRAKGAGFYQFSADEETRRAQMEELRAAREETLAARKEMGAVDIKPGEIEGMQAQSRSGAMEKRKREIEERRRLIEAKRMKTSRKGEPVASPSLPSEAEKPISQATPATSLLKLKPVSNTKLQTQSKPEDDPFAALEAAALKATSTLSASSRRPTEPSADADTFLAQLAAEFTHK